MANSHQVGHHKDVDMKTREGLIYVGGGFLPGVPARDLTSDEVERYGGAEALVATGLYVKPENKSLQQKEAEVKEHGRN